MVDVAAKKVIRKSRGSTTEREKSVALLVSSKSRNTKGQARGKKTNKSGNSGGGGGPKRSVKWNCHRCDRQNRPQRQEDVCTHSTKDCPHLETCTACKMKHTAAYTTCKKYAGMSDDEKTKALATARKAEELQ